MMAHENKIRDRATWPQIGDIIPNHDGNRPPSTDALVGRRFAINAESALSARLDATRCLWADGESALELQYEAFPIADDLFFVDAMPTDDSRKSINLVLDLAGSRAFVVEVTYPSVADAQSALLSRLAATDSQSAVRCRYRQGSLDLEPKESFCRSRALVGKHQRYRYSATHVYDHIYHSEKYYSWFCHRGPDQGLGDFEECDVFELRRNLYLVCWREKLLPCVGIMVENHGTMRSLGKIAGSDAYTGAIGNSRVGAEMSILGDVLGPPL